MVSESSCEKLGFKGFDFNSAVDILMNMRLCQHKIMRTLKHVSKLDTPFRYFNLKGLMNLSTAEYDALATSAMAGMG